MDPFAGALFADGRRVGFPPPVERTVDSIAEPDPAEAGAYRRFIDDAMPLVDAATLGLEVGRFDRRALAGAVARRLPALARAAPRALGLHALLLGSYGRLLEDRLSSEITRGPVSAFAAHAGAGPDAAGGAFFALWQAAYHRYGQWHAVGGAQGLVAALVRRLATLGGELRCDARVARIDATGGGRGGGAPRARGAPRGGGGARGGAGGGGGAAPPPFWSWGGPGRGGRCSPCPPRRSAAGPGRSCGRCRSATPCRRSCMSPSTACRLTP